MFQVRNVTNKRFTISNYHGEIDAVISFDSLTKEFENVKEYDQLKNL